MKIGKKTREDAAIICAVAASHGRRQAYMYAEVRASLGASYRAERLAKLAIDAAISLPATPGPDLQRIDWAEAEAMLRTGWAP